MLLNPTNFTLFFSGKNKYSNMSSAENYTQHAKLKQMISLELRSSFILFFFSENETSLDFNFGFAGAIVFLQPRTGIL